MDRAPCLDIKEAVFVSGGLGGFRRARRHAVRDVAAIVGGGRLRLAGPQSPRTPRGRPAVPSARRHGGVVKPRPTRHVPLRPRVPYLA